MTLDASHPVDVHIAVASDTFAPEDDRWTAQVTAMLDDLRAEVGGVRQDTNPAPGQKGGAAAIILALGTSGAVTAAVQIFKAWLARDRARKITLTVGDVVLEGEDIEADAVVKILEQARR